MYEPLMFGFTVGIEAWKDDSKATKGEWCLGLPVRGSLGEGMNLKR